MSAQNESYRVGIFNDLFVNFCPPHFRNNPFMCPNVMFDQALIFMRCLGIGIKVIRPIFLNQITNTAINNFTDVLPFPVVVYEKDYQSVFVTVPLLISTYGFFTADVDDTVSDIQWAFLASPFTIKTWIAFGVIGVFGVVLLEIGKLAFSSKQSMKTFPLLSRLSFFIEITLTIVVCLYGSNLTAIVNVKGKSTAPFKSIEELTELVRQDKKTLVNDGFNLTYVWRVLSGNRLINGQYDNRLRELYKATERNPSIEITDLEKLCEAISSDSRLVFVGRRSDLSDTCPKFCFWQLDIPQIPPVFRAFQFPHKTRLKVEADVCVSFMDAYHQRQIERKKSFPTKCKRNVQNNLITISSLYTVMCLWLLGTVLSVGVFFAEKITIWYEQMQNSNKILYWSPK